MNTFINTDIMDLLGLKNLQPAEKQKLMDRMLNIVNGRIADRVISVLKTEQRAQFDTILDSGGDPAKVDAFLKQAVPNYDQIAAEEAFKFKQEMVADAENVQALIAGKTAS